MEKLHEIFIYISMWFSINYVKLFHYTLCRNFLIVMEGTTYFFTDTIIYYLVKTDESGCPHLSHSII